MLGTRVYFSLVISSVWVAVFDGVTRMLDGSGAALSIGGIAANFGIALLVGSILGIVISGLAMSANAKGTARVVSGGAIEMMANAPIWVMLIALVGFMVPVAIAVPVRSALLSKSVFVTAFVDVAVLCVGWGLSLFVVKRFAQKKGKRLSRKKVGYVVVAAAAVVAVVFIRQRASLDSSDVWDLVLFAEFGLASLAAALLVPVFKRARLILIVTLFISVIGGAVSIVSLEKSEGLREEVAMDWRPSSWVVKGAMAAWDRDGDGFSPLFGGGDCNDNRDDVNPEGIEIAGNGIDENCRGGDTEPKPPWPPRATFVPLPEGAKEPKSILIITIDALKSSHMGSYGYQRPTTPFLDKFADDSVRFENAYSSAPTTRIALPIMHTGKLLGEIPWNRQVYPYAMQDSAKTLAEILKEERQMKSVAFITHRFLGRKWGWVQGFDEVDTEFVLPRSTYESVATGEDLANKVSGWIEKNQDERFFAWVHFLDPHLKYLKHSDGPDFGDSDLDRYDSEIWYSDKVVGGLLAKLDELGIADDAMVVILSDHGEHLGEHGRKSHGGSLYEEVSQIPLIIRTPGIKPAVAPCITGHVDLAPTILNLMGIDGGKYKMSGASLVPDMTGAKCDEKREIVLEMKYGRLSAPSLKALVGHRWKLIWSVSRGWFKLFDLKNDPKENRNLKKREPEKFKEMKERLLSWNEVYGNREILAIYKELTSEEPPKGATAVNASFTNGVELVATDFGERWASSENPPSLQFYMRTKKRVSQSCQVVFYLFDDDGKMRFKSKHPPINGTFPVARWPLGRVVNDGYTMELRRKLMKNGKLRPGEYEARMGIYCDGRQVPVASGEHDGEGRVRVGDLEIRRARRNN